MIELIDVSFAYESLSAPALSDINLTIEDGQIIGIVGHNGSGKSTLSKQFNALLLPTKGKVLIDGMDTSDESNVLSIRQRVGIVFQNPDNQLVTSVVEEDVAFGPENLGVDPSEIRQRVDRALAAVGMSDFALRSAHHLSGGQKQRIAIAGMLAMQPRVLVLDEATAMLDPKGRQELIEAVRQINRDKGITIIMITQYMEEVTCCDKVVVMHGGRIAMTGTPEQVFCDINKLNELGLDAPEAATIREKVKSMGYSIPNEVLTVDALSEALCPLL